MLSQNAATRCNIIGNYISSERNHRGMTNYTILENSNVRSSTANIHEYHACLFFLLIEYSFRRSERLKNQFMHLKIGLAYTFVNVLCCIYLSGNDMKIGLKANTRVTDGIFDALVIINDILLW